MVFEAVDGIVDRILADGRNSCKIWKAKVLNSRDLWFDHNIDKLGVTGSSLVSPTISGLSNLDDQGVYGPFGVPIGKRLDPPRFV
jgi:hypothetical protein